LAFSFLYIRTDYIGRRFSQRWHCLAGTRVWRRIRPAGQPSEIPW
jgi:hypothetical protein